MFLSRLTLTDGTIAKNWVANAYRVHQRLTKACDNRGRILFRIEESPARPITLLVQTEVEPEWEAAFHDLDIFGRAPEIREFELKLSLGTRYAFRLLANPTVCRDGRRLGVFKEPKQRDWLVRKMEGAGARVLDAAVCDLGFVRSHKGTGQTGQTHLAIRFDGILQCDDPARLSEGVRAGIGAAKGYGFGLLSLAHAR